MSETMQAAWYEALGPARDVLQTGAVPMPVAAPGEVLVRIRASGINPSDVKKRSGARGRMPFARIIPHSDGAGEIEAVGEGVAAERIGERVWVWNAQGNRPFGTAAEYVALPAEQAVPLPENLSFEAGACLGIPAMTAHVALEAGCAAPSAGLERLRGQSLLVTGANGAVAHYAIGFGKRAGARIVATAARPEAAEAARAMGCDRVIAHASAARERFVEEIADFTGGAGVDRIVTSELGSILDVAAPALKSGGTIAAYGSELAPAPVMPFYALMFKNACLQLIFVYEAAAALRRAAVEGINLHMASGRIPAVVDRAFPLEDIAAAHERVESGAKTGAVLLNLP